MFQVIFILKRRDGSIITVRGKKQLPSPTWGEGGIKFMVVCFEHTQDQANIQYSVLWEHVTDFLLSGVVGEYM